MKKTILDMIAAFAITAIIAAFVYTGVMAFMEHRRADIVKDTVKETGTVTDVDTVPPDRIDRGAPSVESLQVGESCWVSLISYDVATDGSIWIRPGGMCSGGEGFMNSIEVRRTERGLEASIDEVFQEADPATPEQLKHMGHTRIAVVTVRPKKK